MSRPRRSVVDSSVVFKWFEADREKSVAEAAALLTAHRDEHIVLHAPDHLRLEVLNALRSRGLDAEHLAQAARILEGFRLEWHRVDGDLAASAAVLAARHSLTLYDAAFAALARDLDAELITADRRLADSGACRARLLGS